MSKRRSPIWNFFTASEGDALATCTICKFKVPRGGLSVKSFTTSNLVSHLRKHHEAYRTYKEQKSEMAESSPRPRNSRQLTIEESNDRVKVWETSDPRAIRISEKIGEMVAVDCQPLSMVADKGFIRLMHAVEPRYTVPSRKYLTEKILPCIYDRVLSKVKDEVSTAKWMSFTSDIWSTEVSNESLISLTAHWISPTFERKSAMLHASPLPGSHTGAAIREKCEKMLENWNIDKEQTLCFVTDNAANMKKAMEDGEFLHIPCFAHTLQLVISDGILSQRYVTDILSKCRRIVGHFKHSQLAYSKFKDIQTSLGMPNHRLVQDVSTRWNSSLYMLQSIFAQKASLAVYSTENEGIPHLTSHQFEIMETLINILKPIEDITQSISSDSASASCIIPYVRALRKSLEENTSDRGVETMKKEMVVSLNRRFNDIESNEILVLSTVLDPCFKDRFFSSAIEREAAKKLLIEKMECEVEQEEQRSLEPPEKRPRTAVMKCFEVRLL